MAVTTSTRRLIVYFLKFEGGYASFTETGFVLDNILAELLLASDSGRLFLIPENAKEVTEIKFECRPSPKGIA